MIKKKKSVFFSKGLERRNNQEMAVNLLLELDQIIYQFLVPDTVAMIRTRSRCYLVSHLIILRHKRLFTKTLDGF